MLTYHLGGVHLLTLFCQRCDHPFLSSSIRNALCLDCRPAEQVQRAA
jgi:hypothetical protein